MPHSKLSASRLPTLVRTLDHISQGSHLREKSRLQVSKKITWILTSKIIACVLIEARTASKKHTKITYNGHR